MSDTGIRSAFADSKVDARIVQHPLRVVLLRDRRLGRKQRAVELDRLGEVVNADMDV
jgi:hypothetical protein